MAYSTPTTRADGYVVDAAEWNKNTVDNPVALRTGAIAIASQAANDIIYAGTASQLARLAAGTSGQVLTTQGAGSAPVWATPSGNLGIVNGRLSLTTATPVTTSDVTAATTLYFALYGGNQISLYTGTGSVWSILSIAELSIAVPATTDTNYDVFVDYNAGTPQLSLTAWTNATTRATALTTQNGVLVKTGATGSRYVGSFRTTGVSGQTEDSFAKRFVWNYYNRLPREMRVIDSTNTWDYTTATWRQANGATTNQLACIIGVAEVSVDARVLGLGYNDGGSVYIAVGIGYDSTSAPTAGNLGMSAVVSNAGFHQITSTLKHYPAVGYHTYVWLEYSTAASTTHWAGDNGATIAQSGISGVVHG